VANAHPMRETHKKPRLGIAKASSSLASQMQQGGSVKSLPHNLLLHTTAGVGVGTVDAR
jgi:hypothetical protein